MTIKIRAEAVWITWERQTRNQSASNFFDVPLYEIVENDSNNIIRYFKSTLRTLAIIKKHRPVYLFVQNPSVILAALAILIKKVSDCKVIIDAHNSGIHGPDRFKSIIATINRLIIRNANSVIVTNSELASYIGSCGGSAIILPDPLPALSNLQAKKRNTPPPRLKALCITSWNEDEPYSKILEAAKSFRGDIDFYFSGNFERAHEKIPPGLTENIKLLGFVSENEFRRHLFSSDFCIDMTTRSDCLVCGAYESIAAEKPVILSDSKVQRNYFYKGAVFSKTNSSDISDAIVKTKKELPRLKKEAINLKQEILQKEKNQKSHIISIINSL